MRVIDITPVAGKPFRERGDARSGAAGGFSDIPVNARISLGSARMR
jgi:hypothetical protein